MCSTSAAGISLPVFFVRVDIAQALSVGLILFDPDKLAEACISSKPDVEVVVGRIVLDGHLVGVELLSTGREAGLAGGLLRAARDVARLAVRRPGSSVVVPKAVSERRVAHTQWGVAAVLLAEVKMVAAMLVIKKELDAHACCMNRNGEWLRVAQVVVAQAEVGVEVSVLSRLFVWTHVA